MRTGWHLQNWIAVKAWQTVAGWPKIDLDPRSSDARELWSVIGEAVPAVIRADTSGRLAVGSDAWLHRRPTPASVSSWMIPRPDPVRAEHVRLRLDIWPIQVGDHVRLEHGRLTAMAYSTTAFGKVIFVLPNGEIETDPQSPEMARAWASYHAARH